MAIPSLVCPHRCTRPSTSCIPRKSARFWRSTASRCRTTKTNGSSHSSSSCVKIVCQCSGATQQPGWPVNGLFVTVRAALGIPSAALTVTNNPLTGQPGCWVAPEHWQTILTHELELWEEPLVFVVRHLEAVLRQNLADFLGMQEVEGLVQRWGQTREGIAITQKVLPDGPTRLHFARLLRALVEEQVPISSWQQILASAEASGLDNPENALRAVRLRLKEQLPGNDPNTVRAELPSEWNNALEKWLTPGNGENAFAPPPHEAYRFRIMLEGLLQSSDGNVALVVDRPEIRPHVRRFLEPWFPNLMILSREEALSHDVHAAD